MDDTDPRRTEQVRVRLTAEELRELDQLAARLRTKRSEALRQALRVGLEVVRRAGDDHAALLRSLLPDTTTSDGGDDR